MEEDKKKKKNKKKKNKQANKPTESVTHDARESTSDQQSHVPNIGHDKNGQISAGSTAASNDVGRNFETDTYGHIGNGSEGEYLAKVDKQYLLDREASFQEKIKELQAENIAKIRNEAILEEKIKRLLEEKDENLQKEVTRDVKIKHLHDEKSASMQKENNLKEKIIQLEKEKDALIEKEGSLEQRTEQLKKENDSNLQKEAALESKILQLEGERDSWLQKEAGLVEKINKLVEKAADLNSELVSLQEKIKQMERERDTWILSENSTKESIASLNNENTKLRAQVTELEQSRNSLLEEKQHLIENISNLQLQILSNYTYLDQHSAPEHTTAHSVDSSIRPPNLVGPDGNESALAADDSVTELNKMLPVSGTTESLEDIIIEDQRNDEYLNEKYGSGRASSSEIIEVDEIVQIPLHENEAMEINLQQVDKNEESTDVPLTEAPLIGAPFRLISFFARYVSGADLVDKNSGSES